MASPLLFLRDFCTPSACSPMSGKLGGKCRRSAHVQAELPAVPLPAAPLPAPCRRRSRGAVESPHLALPLNPLNVTMLPVPPQTRRYYMLAAYSRAGSPGPTASVIVRFRPDQPLPPLGTWANPDKVPTKLPFTSNTITVSAQSTGPGRPSEGGRQGPSCVLQGPSCMLPRPAPPRHVLTPWLGAPLLCNH